LGKSASSVGKRVGGFLYVHRAALDLIDPDAAAAIRECAYLVTELPWNVAKYSGQDISLLVYEDFDRSAFPALLTSAKVDAATGKVMKRDYAERNSPPILHRKETLLRPDDPRIPKFTALTKAAEEFGLFVDAKTIGTKRKWEERIRAAGLRMVENDLVPDGEIAVKVERHRTAIIRRDLSQPMTLMLRLGMIKQDRSIFDYGCGQGDDISTLQANGFEAFGWDPHHMPAGPRRKADTVNLGFVLNVIENPHERLETLRDAWSFAGRAITVSVILQSKSQGSRFTPYKDGCLTRWGTFQRYFSQDELRDLVSGVTGEQPMSLARGIVSVFRDKELEQEVSYRRRSRASAISERFVAPARTPRVVDRPRAPLIRERIVAELEAIWRVALTLGRLPDASEIPGDILPALSNARISTERAIALCADGLFEASLLQEAADARRDDLLVHFALTMFPGAPKYVTLPRSIQRDVRTFFGNHTRAMDLARALLFSVGKPETVLEAIEQASSSGLGGMDNGMLRFQSGNLSRMPTAIRIVVGCAEVIEPDLSSYDFIEVEPESGKVRAFRCDDAAKSVPTLLETVTVDLKALKRKRSNPKDVMLYLKGRYLAADDPSRPAQQKIDGKLLKFRLVSESGDGPSGEELVRILRKSK
jgi:DNA phosphorothioation-associated putative methyltransferase